ncbi:MAG: hypothetical protein EHM53_12535 [Methanoregulaceae archaeon]|nr:MAG: hypothetical protein EHM53_12535 [Methanoregulaceae archaeon]
MDLGKIMIGIALVMLSVGVLASPSGATGPDHSCTVGCGSDISTTGAMVTPYSPPERETPAGYLAPIVRNTTQGSTP